MVRAGLVAVLLCGCNGLVSGRATSERSSGQFVRPDAPHPQECGVDADCVPGPAVDPGDGCCDSGVPLGLYGRSYVEWRAQWRAKTCAAVQCPAQSSPALPRSCALVGRCAAGRCSDTCGGDVPVEAPGEVQVELVVLRGLEVPDVASEGEWAPTDAEVAEIGRILGRCLPTFTKADGARAEDLQRIRDRLEQTRGQLLPYRVQGRRFVLANLFSRLPESDWRREFLSTRGGGADYFKVTVEVDAKVCSDLRINSGR